MVLAQALATILDIADLNGAHLGHLTLLEERDIHTVVQLGGVEHVLKLDGAVFTLLVGHAKFAGFEAGASAAREVAVSFSFKVSGLQDLHVVRAAANFEAANALGVADLGTPLEQLAGLGLSDVALLALISFRARSLVNAAPRLQHVNRGLTLTHFETSSIECLPSRNIVIPRYFVRLLLCIVLHNI